MDRDISVVLASNRGPVEFLDGDDGFTIKRGAGGLAGALDPVARSVGEGAVWIAATNSKTDRRAVAAGAADGLESQLGYRLRLLDFNPHMYSRYYNVVSNRMLWFANHCLLDELGITGFGREELAAWRNAYEPVNRAFAQAVLEVGDSNALVLFQDYHLTTAPRHLRRENARQTIFHFTHSSFCGPKDLDRLPSPIPTGVIEGMLGADLVGFHVSPWVDGFLQCCDRVGAEVDRSKGLVDFQGRATWVRQYPIPIDAVELRERAAKRKARRWAGRFTERGQRLIVRADRTEPSKNIVRGFQAFGLLLDRRADLRDELRFVACLYPSRHSMTEYRRYTEAIKKIVGEVNERHPGAIELFLKDDYDRTLGALLVYDVLLVNPLMDGMNLVSKEGPAVNETSGVLVLTKGAGSFQELGEHAVEVDNACDVEATADAIERALEMPLEERTRRASALRATIDETAPADWIGSQLDDLVSVNRGSEPKTLPAG